MDSNVRQTLLHIIRDAGWSSDAWPQIVTEFPECFGIGAGHVRQLGLHTVYTIVMAIRQLCWPPAILFYSDDSYQVLAKASSNSVSNGKCTKVLPLDARGAKRVIATLLLSVRLFVRL